MKIKNKCNVVFSKMNFKFKKHSPELLVAAGIVGAVASTVAACRATTKLNGILEKTKEDVDLIHKYADDESVEEYSQEDVKKDLTIVYAHTGVEIAKLYMPAIAIGILSVTSILASNNIMRKRNVALTAAYAAVDKSYKEYRGRVAERFGEAVDRELRYNIKAKKFEETVTDEDGKEKKIKKTIDVVGNDTYSDYACFFDESCSGWERTPDYNISFLKAQQQYANDLLRAKGYLFLNDVHDMLGIEKTKAGQIVGWIYDPSDDERDNYVDFGIMECNREYVRDSVNGYEPAILLDFNVDGNIWGLMDEKEGFNF